VTGTPTDVQTILSTAATALVTLTSVVLSLTLVAVQLAMGQFSPRIVGALLNDRLSQAAIALFAGTFSYAMLVTREVNDKTGAVPGLSVLVSYALILGSVLVLVLFVHHAGQGIRASGRTAGRCSRPPRRAMSCTSTTTGWWPSRGRRGRGWNSW
jgi:uncharacterized membrane protein